MYKNSTVSLKHYFGRLFNISLRLFYWVFQVSFECKHCYVNSPGEKYYSMSILHFISIIQGYPNQYNSFQMVSFHHNKIAVLTHDFQHCTKKTVKIRLAWYMLKIMWMYWITTVMQIEHLTAVEKHLASSEKWYKNWKSTWKSL